MELIFSENIWVLFNEVYLIFPCLNIRARDKDRVNTGQLRTTKVIHNIHVTFYYLICLSVTVHLVRKTEKESTECACVPLRDQHSHGSNRKHSNVEK